MAEPTVDDLRAALLRLAMAVLMFYQPRFEPGAWQALTGRDEATTKVLGDLAREALAMIEKGTDHGTDQ